MENAEWPSQPIPAPVKQLIARFYSLVDSTEANCSQELADTVFTPDGEFVINKRKMKGAGQIAKWRTGGNSITLRQHEVHKVYTCNDLGDDVLMTGTLTLGSSSGLTAEGPYCARCVVDDASSPSPKIKHWQGWVDNTPFADLGIQRTPVTRTMNGILDTIGGR